MNRIVSAIASIACATFASSVSAAVAFVTPDWQRPSTTVEASATLSTYQHWDVFTSRTTNVPDVANINPNGTADAFDANYPASGTNVTSTGNLYSGSGIIRMNVVVPNYAATGVDRTQFVLQLKTIGSALFDTDGYWSDPPIETDFSRLNVNGIRIDSLASFEYEVLNLAPGSGPTSFDVERAIRFELPGNLDSYTIEWSTARGSNSQMEIAVDTHVVVPEPASLVLGSAALVALRRRRRIGVCHG